MTPKIVGCLSMSTIGIRGVTIGAICGHVHVNDSREGLSDV